MPIEMTEQLAHNAFSILKGFHVATKPQVSEATWAYEVIGDWGKRAQPTTVQLERRRVYR